MMDNNKIVELQTPRKPEILENHVLLPDNLARTTFLWKGHTLRLAGLDVNMLPGLGGVEIDMHLRA